MGSPPQECQNPAPLDSDQLPIAAKVASGSGLLMKGDLYDSSQYITHHAARACIS